MISTLSQRLRWLSQNSAASIVTGGLRGVEREALRVTAEGYLATTPHPRALGSALTHDYITTDYSEALLEFVTPAYSTTWETMQFLCDLHQWTSASIGEELLWPASMPCFIGADEDIPIARYGDSNVGRMKYIYRLGLGLRYGRRMQTIAGIHYNYSLPEAFWQPYQSYLGSAQDERDFRSEAYMGLVRNFRRIGWIVLLLQGSSPAICKSFLPQGHPGLESLDGHTWYAPHGTSLRMSELGYQNSNQARLNISPNSLSDYIEDLTAAIREPSAEYEALGLVDDSGFRQLNTHILQIENEYYSPIRPKRRARSGERPTLALSRAGVEYVELRSLDINVAHPAGINQSQMRFLEALSVYCLLIDSPPISAAEQVEIDARQVRVARRGREPGLTVPRDGMEVDLRSWAAEIVEGVSAVAELLDDDSGDYRAAAAAEAAKLSDLEACPSALVLAALNEERVSYFDFALGMAERHRRYFADLSPLPEAKRAHLEQEAVASLERQAALEATPSMPFEDYLAAYYAPHPVS